MAGLRGNGDGLNGKTSEFSIIIQMAWVEMLT
jgi:hypothetical protein